MDGVAYLIKKNYAQDRRGVWKWTEERRRVFCQTGSVSRTEFFEAGRSGLNPAFVLTVFAGDYDGEDMVEYEGKAYGIYRTYQSKGNSYVGVNTKLRQDLLKDYVELYLEEKGGVNEQS